MRKYTLAKERAGKKKENDHPPFWIYGESIRTSVHSLHGNDGNAEAADCIVECD